MHYAKDKKKRNRFLVFYQLCVNTWKCTILAQALWKNKIINKKSSSEVLSVCSIHNIICLKSKYRVCVNKVPTVIEIKIFTDMQE